MCGVGLRYVRGRVKICVRRWRRWGKMRWDRIGLCDIAG